ncbi:MAG: hypothetical protein H6925_04510 [Holosporaceae bacterium]|nr:MAG: hypothetical protein H6925_04510 [Holosporaceae bacterium]
MLRQLSTEGVLRHGAAFIDKCMHVQSFSDQNPGWFSTQLFGVFVKAACGAGPKDHLAYIIKEVAKKDVELKNLAVLSGSDLKRYDLTNPYRSKLFQALLLMKFLHITKIDSVKSIGLLF